MPKICPSYGRKLFVEKFLKGNKLSSLTDSCETLDPDTRNTPSASFYVVDSENRFFFEKITVILASRYLINYAESDLLLYMSYLPADTRFVFHLVLL